MQNISSISSNQQHKVELLFNATKNKLSPPISEKAKDAELKKLEKNITNLFPSISQSTEKNESFESFAKTCTRINPSLTPQFVGLFLYLKSYEEIIDLCLDTLNKQSNLEQELQALYKKIPYEVNLFRSLIYKLELHFHRDSDKQLAYKLLVEAFNINTVEKFISLGTKLPQFFAIESAKFTAREDVWGVSRLIKCYAIKDEKMLIEIAKIEASLRAEEIFRYIQNYEIKNEKELIKIVEIAAYQNGSFVFSTLETLWPPIDDPNFLENSDIQYFRQPQDFLKNFRIKNKKIAFRIFLIAMGSSNGEANKYRKEHHFPKDFCPQIFEAFNLLTSNKMSLTSVYKALREFIADNNLKLSEKVVDYIVKQNRGNQKKLLLWIFCFLGHCSNEKLSSNQFNFLSQNGFLEAVLRTDDKMRYKLIKNMIAMVNYEDELLYARSLLKSKDSSYCRLSILLLSEAFGQGINQEICDQNFDIATLEVFRKGKNLKIYVNTMHSILESTLNVEDKEYLISQISPEKALFTLLTIKAIFDMNQIEYLTKENLEQVTIFKALEKNVRKLIPSKAIYPCVETYAEHFLNVRNPNFILEYAKEMQSDKEALKLLSYITDAILSDKFLQIRYDLTRNENLKTIFSENPILFQEWKKGGSLSFNSLFSKRYEKAKGYEKFRVSDTDNYEDLFCAKMEAKNSFSRLNDESHQNFLKTLISGENRLLTVKDEKGKIVAALSLTISQNGKKTTLQLQNYQAGFHSPLFDEALKKFALQRAKHLGLKLILSDK